MSQSRKRKRPPKHILALPDLEQSKAAVLNSLTSKSGQRTYDRAITDLSIGTARNHGFRLTEPSFSDTGSFSNRSAMRQRRSTFGSRPYGESPLKRRILVCLARNWPPAFDASKACAGSAFALETG
jgi:hypothetical protein